MKFLWKCLAVFGAMTLLDVVFAMYVRSVADHNIAAASSWAAAIQFCNVYVVLEFVKDKRLVVPCAAGAFIGTGLSMALL